MLHSLHCVDTLRKAADMEYYADKIALPAEFHRLHVDHCVDQLRQAIMCHGDLTPVSLASVELKTRGGGKIRALLGETEREHTCRDFAALRDWVTNHGRKMGTLGI